MTVDHARAEFLIPQLHEQELAKILVHLHRRLSTAERNCQWKQALELARREETILEILCSRGQAK